MGTNWWKGFGEAEAWGDAVTSQGHLAAWPPSPGHTQPSPALAQGSAATEPAAPLCQWPTGEELGPGSAKGSKLHFIPASLPLRSLGREEGLVWPLARGQLTMKCESQLSPDPSATCREIPRSHLPPSFQSRCLGGLGTHWRQVLLKQGKSLWEKQEYG